jgi:hypothetical protein
MIRLQMQSTAVQQKCIRVICHGDSVVQTVCGPQVEWLNGVEPACRPSMIVKGLGRAGPVVPYSGIKPYMLPCAFISS